MERRKLGRSDLEVSALGLGCNNFGMTIEREASRAVIDAALDAGVDFFDTADLYGGTRSEEFLGEALAGRRERVVLATKFGGMAHAQGAKERWGTREYIVRCVEESLRRLRTDRIDLYQIHYPDPRTPIEETLAALGELVRAGKLRFVGCSNFSGSLIDEADARARERDTLALVSAQNEWSLLQREAEAEVVPACERHGIGMLPYFPLASGVLTGKHRRGRGFAPDTRLAMDYFKHFGSDANLARAEALEDWARERGHSLLELAIGWLLSQRCVGSVIAGATRPEQVRANAAASAWRLSEPELAAVDSLLRS